jgi:hypothetical protein
MPEERTTPDLVERTRRFFASSNEATVSATGVVAEQLADSRR